MVSEKQTVNRATWIRARLHANAENPAGIIVVASNDLTASTLIQKGTRVCQELSTIVQQAHMPEYRESSGNDRCRE
jgi:hypothetical protein